MAERTLAGKNRDIQHQPGRQRDHHVASGTETLCSAISFGGFLPLSMKFRAYCVEVFARERFWILAPDGVQVL